MSVLRRILSAFRTTPQPEPPPPLPHGKARIHLFAANFASAQEAERYCYASNGDRPEPLTRDQPGAFIDTRFVEVNFGDHSGRLAEFLDSDVTDPITRALAGHNTLIIIAEDAFGGFPYTLNDTDDVIYLGPQIVNI